MDNAIHVLISAGVSSPSLRLAAEHGVKIDGAGHAEVAVTWLKATLCLPCFLPCLFCLTWLFTLFFTFFFCNLVFTLFLPNQGSLVEFGSNRWGEPPGEQSFFGKIFPLSKSLGEQNFCKKMFFLPNGVLFRYPFCEPQPNAKDQTCFFFSKNGSKGTQMSIPWARVFLDCSAWHWEPRVSPICGDVFAMIWPLVRIKRRSFSKCMNMQESDH